MAHNQPIIRLWPTTELDCGPHHQPIIRLWPTTELDCGPHHQTVAHSSIRLWPTSSAYHQTVAHSSIRLWPTTTSDCGPNHQSVPVVAQVNVSLTWSQVTRLKTGGRKDEIYFGVFTLNTGRLCCLMQATTRMKRMKRVWLNQQNKRATESEPVHMQSHIYTQTCTHTHTQTCTQICISMQSHAHICMEMHT